MRIGLALSLAAVLDFVRNSAGAIVSGLALLILWFVWSGAVKAEEWTIEPYLKLSHMSAFTRGKPWNDKTELTVDSIQLCADFKKARIEIALCQGFKCLECALGHSKGYLEESSELSLRWYFGRD